MPIVVAEGVVEVSADAGGVSEEVARDLQRNTGPVVTAGTTVGKQFFGALLKGWVAIGGITAVVGFLSGAVTGASDLNEEISKSEQIFGSAAGTILTWGSTAATSVGLSKTAAIQAASNFGNMFTQLGWTSQAAAELSTSTVQLAADLGSFNNLPTAEVADMISAAFRGEYDSLQRLIPNINAARVEQEAMAMTGKTNASQLNAQEKAAATLALITKDGERALGDFARTSDGAANKTKIVTAGFEDQQQKLGTQLLPIWQGFLGFLADIAIPTLGNLITFVQDNASWLTPLAIAIGVATVAQWAWNVALTANPIGIIIVAIGALVAGLIWFFTQTEVGKQMIDGFFGAMKMLGDGIIWLWENALVPFGEAVGVIFTWIYENIIVPIVTGIMVYIGLWAAVFTWLWENVISPVFGFIGAIFGWVYNNVIVPIVGLIVGYVQMWGAIFTWLWENAISPAFQAIAAGFNWVWANVISPVVGFITGAIDTVGSTVRNVFGGIASFIGSAFQSVLGVIRGPINGIISMVNSVIGAINGIRVTIPDWVPMVGGQTFGLSIPTIPMLARGALNAPDTFIAGENGPELITGGRGARVYNASDTRRMLGGGDTNVTAYVTIDARSVKDFTDVVEIVLNLPQVARAGRGRG